MSYRINLVEDEQSLREILVSYLEKDGYTVKSFADGESALEHTEDDADLWVLDIMLPGIDGFEILREIKAVNRDLPVIFISARDRSMDRVIGLEMGGDDYLAKPFLPRELLIRVRKILERTVRAGRPAGNELMNIGSYIIRKDFRQVSVNGGDIELTTMEFDLLLLLAENPGKAFTREQLIDRVWGEDHYTSERAVDDLIRRLRSKMKDLPIETIYGFGYRMNRV